jgi:hypothetical protein
MVAILQHGAVKLALVKIGSCESSSNRQSTAHRAPGFALRSNAHRGISKPDGKRALVWFAFD